MNGGFPPIKLIKETEIKSKKSQKKISGYQLPSILNIKDILQQTKSEFILDESTNKLDVIKTFN